MTETPQNESVNDTEGDLAGQTGDVHCRHCGHANEISVQAVVDGEDWLCEHCQRFQDSMTCPTCGNLARISLMPKDLVPEPHAPVKRKRS